MLVRIKPCINFGEYNGVFVSWARSFKDITFEVKTTDRYNDRYFPDTEDTSFDPRDWKFFLKKELIFIKEKK